MNRRRRVVVAALLTILLAALGATGSAAATSSGPAVPSTSVAQAWPWRTDYSVTVIRRSQGVINANDPLGTCKGGQGITCTIDVSTMKSATRSISLALGAPRGVVAAGLNMSTTTSVSITHGCGPVLTSAYRPYLRAYPVGQQTFYTITAKKYEAGKLVSTTTSGTLAAFDPYPNNVFCALG